MNSVDIYNILKLKLGKQFSGVFACDVLPLHINYPSAIVINLDTHTQPGSHWVAVYFDKKRFASYMDSFGLPPLVPSIVRFIQRHSVKSNYNSNQIQHISSTKCGKFCIVYLIQRGKGLSNKLFLNQFKSTKTSDKIIEKLYKNETSKNRPRRRHVGVQRFRKSGQ